MDSLDRLLAQLKAENRESAEPELKKDSCLDNLLSDFQAESEQIEQQTSSRSVSSLDNLLVEVKEQYKEQDRSEELRKQQELQQEKIRQQKLKAQQLEELKTQAKVWLEKLEPLSSEGLWFEKFAEKYPSKLEAAIDYLQELKENNGTASY
jgi:hypothetical protein